MKYSGEESKVRLKKQTDARKDSVKSQIDQRVNKVKKTGEDLKVKKFGVATRIDKIKQTVEDAQEFGRKRVKSREEMLTR